MPKLTIDHLKNWIVFFSAKWDSLPEAAKDRHIAAMIAGEDPPEDIEVPVDEYTTEDVMKHIGSVVHKYRTNKKISGTKVGEVIGKSPSHISLVESGQRSLNLVDLQRVMKLLEIPSEEVFIILHS